MDSLALIIPKRIIPDHSRRDDIFELRISRVSNPEKEYVVYTSHKPDYRRAYLPIKHVMAERGEEFYVNAPQRYDVGDFVRDYNKEKPINLENTALSYSGGKVVLEVGRRKLELRGPVLRTQEGKVVMDAKLNEEHANLVKIAKGVDGSEFRLKNDHSVVTSIVESQEGVTIMYRRTKYEVTPHVRVIRS